MPSRRGTQCEVERRLLIGFALRGTSSPFVPPCGNAGGKEGRGRRWWWNGAPSRKPPTLPQGGTICFKCKRNDCIQDPLNEEFQSLLSEEQIVILDVARGPFDHFIGEAIRTNPLRPRRNWVCGRSVVAEVLCGSMIAVAASHDAGARSLGAPLAGFRGSAFRRSGGRGLGVGCHSSSLISSGLLAGPAGANKSGGSSPSMNC